jgi:hypothetical protein
MVYGRSPEGVGDLEAEGVGDLEVEGVGDLGHGELVFLSSLDL